MAAIARHTSESDSDPRRVVSQRLVALRTYLPLWIGFNFMLEFLFDIRGLGQLFIHALNQADMPVATALVCIVALFLVFSYFAIDAARGALEVRE